MKHARPSYQECPANAHPTVRMLFAEMRKQQVTISDLAERSGVIRETISSWRTRNSPKLANMEAVLNVLGYDLRPVRRRE